MINMEFSTNSSINLSNYKQDSSVVWGVCVCVTDKLTLKSLV